MLRWVALPLLVLLSGCGTPSGAIYVPGAKPARKWEGPWVAAPLFGSHKATFYYGPWQCNQRWFDSCRRQCAAEGHQLKGCMWLSDLKLQWNGKIPLLPFVIDSGGRYAITHCCCSYPELTPDGTNAQRNKWENIRQAFRKDWGEKFGNWPTDGGKNWPGHHIHDLKHGGHPTDGNNVLPTPPDVHEIFNAEYPVCYAGGPPWNTPGPDYPYTD